MKHEKNNSKPANAFLPRHIGINQNELKEMLEVWHTVIKAADPFLETLTTEKLTTDLPLDGQPTGQSIGSALRRMTYHYWYHIGEIQSIRQMIGHTGLPDYVGDIEGLAPYRPE